MTNKPFLLFIDATVRPPQLSRTAQLCQAYLEVFRRVHPEYEIRHVPLIKEQFTVTTGEEIEEREAQAAAGNSGHPLLRYAAEFAGAKRILIGAPYWDLSFPAMLKQYIEKTCVRGMVFTYGETGIMPCCRAERLTYLTAGGGEIAPYNCGADYLQGLCATIFGIPDFEWEGAERLDIEGNNPETIMTAAKKRAAALAERP